MQSLDGEQIKDTNCNEPQLQVANNIQFHKIPATNIQFHKIAISHRYKPSEKFQCQIKFTIYCIQVQD